MNEGSPRKKKAKDTSLNGDADDLEVANDGEVGLGAVDREAKFPADDGAGGEAEVAPEIAIVDIVVGDCRDVLPASSVRAGDGEVFDGRRGDEVQF